jgi:hypothetical protein
MSTAELTAPAKERSITIPQKRLDVIRKMQGIVEDCSLSKLKDQPVLEQALMLSAGMTALRDMLTEEVMQDVMGLMNSPLGFLTDRDPARAYGDKEVKPYPLPVVRECFIEAVVRGFRPINNEFNIIGGRFYGAKAGFWRQVTEWPGLTDLELLPSCPILREKEAWVAYEARWRLNGHPVSMAFLADKETGKDQRLKVKVNAGMGDDAIIGKADRKMLARIYQRLSGSVYVPDGEVGDTTTVEATATVVDTPTGASRSDAVAAAMERQRSGNGHADPPAETPAFTRFKSELESAKNSTGVGVLLAELKRSDPPAQELEAAAQLADLRREQLK